MPSFPGWPSVKGWLVISFVALTFYVLRMIEENPQLLANASFMQLVQTLSTGGILLAASYYFGAADRKSHTPGSVEVTPPATIELTGDKPD